VGIVTAAWIARTAYEIHRAYHPPVIEQPTWENASDLVRAYTLARVEYILEGGYWPEFPRHIWEQLGVRGDLTKKVMEDDYAFAITVKQLSAPRVEIG